MSPWVPEMLVTVTQVVSPVTVPTAITIKSPEVTPEERDLMHMGDKALVQMFLCWTRVTGDFAVTVTPVDPSAARLLASPG